MDTKYFDEYLQQLSEWQKKLFDTWMANLPNGKTDINLSETFEKNLQVQEELVKTYLEAQKKASEMMMDTQKQFWDQYFETMRKKTPAGVAQ